MEKLKQEKGSITLFVVVSMLFFILFLTGIYMLSISSQQAEISETAKIKEIYEKDINQIDDVYATLENDLIYYVSDKRQNRIPVPTGFSPINTEDQGTKETGFVIKNDTDGNEFVWVPVDSTTSYDYNRYAFLSNQQANGTDAKTNSIKINYNSSSSYYFTEAMPSIAENRTELDSIKKYGGFYIGRYEAGVATTIERTNSSGTNDVVLVQKGKQVYNYVTRDESKELAQNMYSTNDAVTSKLCSSYAWDTTLKFIETRYPSYPTNGKANNYYGNYLDTEFEYTDLTGNMQTKLNNKYKLVPTGQTTAVNNIYDMGGNVNEWITEEYSDTSKIWGRRGGDYSNNSSNQTSAYRSSGNTTKYEYNGFRIALYL